MSGVVNRQIGAGVRLHDVLNGFQACWETGTASLGANTPQQITAIREEVLYEFFIDLQKSYTALERERCLDIPVGYGIMLRTERILRIHWEHLLIVS